MRDKLIIEKISNAISILDEIDNMIRTQSIELQKVDYKLSDLYHLVENNELSDEASINVVREIHLLRKERRSLSETDGDRRKNQSNSRRYRINKT